MFAVPPILADESNEGDHPGEKGGGVDKCVY